MNELDLAFAAGFDAVKAYVDRGFSILIDRIAVLEAQPHPVKGEPGEAGKSITIDDVRPLLHEMVAELPKPVDGKSIEIAEVAELVGVEVTKAVAAIPLPKDGEPGAPGRDGADGKNIDVAEVAELIGVEVTKAVAAIPLPKDGEPGAPGRDGADGKSIEIAEVAELIGTEVSKAVAGIPVPRDGKDGAPGADGKTGADGIAMAGALIDRDGRLILTLSDGSTRELGVVVGKDADQADIERFIVEKIAELPKPKDGIDGLGFEDMGEELEADGRTIVRRYSRGENVKEFRHKFGVVLDAGVWKAGTFEKGDAVSHGGQIFIARRDTSAEPMTPEARDDWRLSVKKGRDGKDLRPEQKRDAPIVKFK